MKKWLGAILIVISAVFMLTGCSDEKTEKKGESEAAATETPAPEKEVRYAPYFTEEPFAASGVVWIAGDSIASAHDDNGYEVPISGWGEYLADCLNGEAEVHNEARSGRSSKSYLKESNYREITKNMAYGDYLFIAFGLNDEKADMAKLYTDPEGDSDTEESFAWYLKNNYIEPALQAGAEPVLMSPVVRATYEDGKLTEQTQTPYVDAIERLVEEYREKGIDLYYIDLYQITEDWYEELGEEKVMQLHGVDNEGKEDTTHYSEEGARQLAEKIAEEIKAQQMELAEFVK